MPENASVRLTILKADYRRTVSHWPAKSQLPPALREIMKGTDAVLASDWISEAAGLGWSGEDLFGYAETDDDQAAFGIATGMALGLIEKRLIVIARDVIVAKWSSRFLKLADAEEMPVMLGLNDKLKRAQTARFERGSVVPPGADLWWHAPRLVPIEARRGLQ